MVVVLRSVLEREPANRARRAASNGDVGLMVLIRMRLDGDGGTWGEVGFAGAGAGVVYRSILGRKLA